MSRARDAHSSPRGEHDHVKGPLQTILRSRDFKRVLPALLAGSLIANLLALVLPLSILQVFDRVIINQSTATLILLTLGLVVALFLEEGLRALNAQISSWLGARYEHRTSLAALDRLFHIALNRYQTEEPGVHVERVLSAGKVSGFYSGQALMALFDLPFVIIFLGLIYFIAGPLVIIPLVLVLVFSVLSLYFVRYMRQAVHQRQVVYDRRINFLNELLTGIHTVKAMALEPLMLRRYERLQGSNAELSEALTRGNVLANSMGILFSQVMIVTVIFGGAWLVLDNQMTPGALAASMMLAVRAIQPLRRGLRVWMRYQSFVEANDSIRQVMEVPQAFADAGKPELPPVQQQLVLNSVSLAHHGGKPLFTNLSLTVPAGKTLAIQGQSGSGKSTLLTLLNGMVWPDSGHVLADGRPLADFSSDSVHRQIALLPQTPTVFAGTLMENLTNFDASKVPLALELSEALGLSRIVATLPMGYNTPLGQSVAEAFPAGVRQLVTLIRALVYRPSVILFDEANLSLDFEGDRIVRDYFAAQRGKMAMVMITHRPSWLALADEVYHLENGGIQPGALDMVAMEADMADAVQGQERPAHQLTAEGVVREHFANQTDLSRCLSPLLRALQWQENPPALAKALPHMVNELDLSAFCSVMASMGYDMRHVPTSVKGLDARLLPCLLVRDKQSALVITERLPDGQYRYFDGGTGQVQVGMPGGSGEVYVFRTPEKEAIQSAARGNWLLDMAWRFRSHLMLALVVSFLIAALALTPPLFVRAVYDQVLPSSDILMGAFLLIGALIAIGLEWLLQVLKGRVLAYLGGRAEYIMGLGILDKVISLPARSIESSTVNRQVGRIRSLESLREFFIGPMAVLAFDIPASLVLVVALALLNPMLLWIVVVVALVYGLLGAFVWYASQRVVARAVKESADRWDLANEIASNMRAIRALGAGREWFERFRTVNGAAIMDHYRENRWQVYVGSIGSYISTMAGVGALIMSAVLFMQGDLTGGSLMAAVIIFWRLTGPLHNVFLAMTSLARSASSIRQLTNLMRLSSETDTGIAQQIQEKIKGAVTLSRVSFRYTNDADPALLGINLDIAPGELVLVTGSNGSGKSTLLKLMMRMYIPQAGTIKLDQLDTRQLDVVQLRSSISYMPQECQIYYGTVAQNLRIVHPSASDIELRWAMDMAGLSDDVAALPEGINTRISNAKADQLPHGFRQRLSLARTMLRPAPLVLMDEPGNGMDAQGEEALLRCIAWLHQRATVIIVSHRPAHMRLADRVVLLRTGAIAATGSYEDIKEQVMRG